MTSTSSPTQRLGRQASISKDTVAVSTAVGAKDHGMITLRPRALGGRNERFESLGIHFAVP